MAVPCEGICETCPNRDTAVRSHEVPAARISDSGMLVYLIKNARGEARTGSISAEKFQKDHAELIKKGDNCAAPQMGVGEKAGQLVCQAITEEELVEIAAADLAIKELALNVTELEKVE